MPSTPPMPSRLPTPAGGKPSSVAPAALERFRKEAGAVADRLRHLTESRLRAAPAAECEDAPTRAAAGLALARRLADLAAEVEGEPRRTVPDAGLFAVGDQIAVTAADLAAALEAAAAGPAAVDEDGTPLTADEVLERARAAVRTVAAAI